ncbi:MAG: cupin domain-containing protein [Acidimicrobiales bacterium]
MLLVKNLDTPDEKRSFDHGQIQSVSLGGVTVGRAILRPGWRWSQDVKPLVGTDSCQATHVAVIASGRFQVRMDDGHELELGPGEAHIVGPGHDAWVVGDEPCVIFDFEGSPNTGARVTACPCGVSFRIESDDALDHLVAAVQEHAAGSHDSAPTREHILSELTTA